MANKALVQTQASLEAGAVKQQSFTTQRTIPTTCVETIGGDPNTAIRLSFQIKVF